MPAQITLKAKGLSTSPNALETKDGGLTTASNIIIKRDNVMESRRGMRLYGTAATTAIKQLFTYKDRILRHFGSTLQFDTEILNADEQSIFNSFASNFEEVDPGLRIKSIESNGNFYFTTSEGIKKISAASPDQFTTAAGYVTNAGGVKAINGSARIDFQLGNSTGFLPENSTVAYRAVWGIRDANNNSILGTPSERIVLYNSLLTFLISDFDRILGALDDITETTPTAFIGDGDYVDTLALEYNATAPEVQSQIIALAAKIDNDIWYANVGGGATPLDMTGATAISANGTSCTITFAVGDPTTYWAAGSHIFLQGFTGAPAAVNGSQVVSAVTATTVTFNTSETFAATATGATAEIHSYEYRFTISNIDFNGSTVDLTTQTVNNPATGDQLQIMQAALDQIITQLQAEPTTVISALNQSTYITPLDVTTTANVILTVNIPQDVTPNHFVQIYRSNISIATGTTVLSDLTPDDEMQQVYEAFPTAAELAAGQMIILDQTIDAFAGQDLYTNPSLGGILLANDVPPLAKDINRFKNVLFYANTKTRERLNVNLLGVQNFNAGNIVLVTAGAPATITTDTDHNLEVDQIVYINGTGIATLDQLVHRVATTPTSTTFTVAASGGAGSTTGYWSNSMVAIIHGATANQYYFIRGTAEITNIATIPDVAGSLAGDYFYLNSGKDQSMYYVWYEVSGSGTDPLISGRTGIKVAIATGDTANTVAFKTRNTLARVPSDFIISGATNNVIVTNVIQGTTTDATAETSGFTITITQQGRGENAAFNEVLLSTVVSPAQAVDETARSFQNVVNLNTAETLYIFYLSGLVDVPGKMLFEGRELDDPEFFIVANNFDTGNSFDPPIVPNPDDTLSNSATNPSVVTLTAHGLVSGDIAGIAFSNSSPSINGEQLITFLTVNTFSVPVNVTTAGTTGVIIKKSLSVASDNEEKQNRIYYSKINQPEAVPITNYFDVGSEEKAILRIFPLRDSLFVFKEDGLFRVSGETAPFNLALFDSSCVLIAADSLGLANNLIYGWTTQGIHAVSEAGIDIVSREIDINILRLASANFINFKTVTWGVGYDSDNSYTVYTNFETNDTVAMIGYRFGNLTNSWTTIDKTTTCGIINPADDKMYVGAGDVNFIEEERKSFDRTDYADRELRLNLSTDSFFNAGTKIKLSSVAGIEIGDVFYQEQRVTVVNFNALLLKLDNDAAVASVQIESITTGSNPLITTKNDQFVAADVNTVTDTITIPGHGYVLGNKVRFLSTGTLPAPLVADTTYFILNPTLNTFQLAATLGGAAINLTTGGVGTHTIYRYHNLIVNDFVILANTNSDPIIDGTYQVDTVPSPFSFTIAIPEPVTTAGTSGIARFDYLTTQEMIGGDDIRTKLVELANKLDTDPGTQFSNYFDIIDSKSGVVTNITATNPAVITSAGHELQNGRYIALTGTNTVPIIDGNYAITVVDANNFSVPVSVTISGNTGSWSTLNSDFRDLFACFNAIVNNLNIDPGVIFNNYVLIDSTTPLESLITGVNQFTNELTLDPGINFLVGPIIVFKAIQTDFQYEPQTMGDPLGWKHLMNFTMMFESKAFTKAVIAFASDLLPEFIPVEFLGDGNGIFGFNLFGNGFFGGGSHGAPFRTYFPRQVMRCRYVLIKFTHRIAREKWSCFGITIDGSISQSNRAYRR